MSFCVLKFRNAPAPDVCVARAYGFTRFSSSPRRARVFGCVHHSTKASCAGASFTVAVSYGAWLLRSPRAVDIDGGRALRARSAEDRRKAIRKRIARTVVDDDHESARTGRAAKVAVCMYEEQKRKSRFKSVQLYSCSVHAMEYLYEYIYSAR